MYSRKSKRFLSIASNITAALSSSVYWVRIAWWSLSIFLLTNYFTVSFISSSCILVCSSFIMFFFIFDLMFWIKTFSFYSVSLSKPSLNGSSNKTPCFVRDGDNRMNTNWNSVLSIEWINYYNEGVFYLRGITIRPCTISQSPRSWLSQCQGGLGSWRIRAHGFDLSSFLAFEAPQIYFSLWSAQFYHSRASSKSDVIDYRCRDAVS